MNLHIKINGRYILMHPRVYADPPEDMARRLRHASMGCKHLPDEASIPFDYVKPKKRFRQRSKALKEIRKYQRSTDLLIPKEPFRRLVKDIAQEYNPRIRFQVAAITALQEAAEAYIVGMMEDGVLCTVHANRVTTMKKDICLAARIRGDDN